MSKLTEHKFLKGFYKHPKLHDLYLNKEGQVYDGKTQQHNNFGISSGYITVRGLHLHKLLAELFLKKPENISKQKLVVNHIDGNKLNNNISNLEWITYSGNNIHAYINKLHPRVTPILVKNIETNEINRFYSLQECARHFNINGGKLFYYLKNGTNKVRLNKFIFIYEGQEWPSDYKNGSAFRFFYVKDKKLNKVFIFEGAKKASEHVGINDITFFMRIKRAIEKGQKEYEDENFSYSYFSKTLDICCEEDIIKADYKKQNLFEKRKEKPIEVTFFHNNETKKMSGVSELAVMLKMNKDSLVSHIYRNNGVYKNLLRVKYI